MDIDEIKNMGRANAEATAASIQISKVLFYALSEQPGIDGKKLRQDVLCGLQCIDEKSTSDVEQSILLEFSKILMEDH